MTLWPHQQHLLELTHEGYLRGERRPLLVLPTGGGKTRVASVLAEELLASGRTVTFAAHLRELLDQARRHLPSDVVTVSVQQRKFERSDVLIIDESHHATAKTYQAMIQAVQPSLLIGMTATPSRLDGTALGGVFDSIHVGATTSELITRGILVPTRVVSPDEPMQGKLAMHPVDAYRGGKALCYAASVEHAARLADEFVMRGIPAASLDGKTKDRDQVVRRFASGQLRVLTTYRLVAEGFDIPDCSTVIIASNMTSPAMLLQAVGRGKRCAPGKREELLLDLAGVCISLAMHPDDDLVYSLEGKPISKTTERGDRLRACPDCGMLFWANEYRDSTCPECGYVRPGKADPRVVQARIEERKQDFFASLVAKNPKEVELMKSLLSRGYKLGWAKQAFRRETGHWPSKKLMEAATK